MADPKLEVKQSTGKQLPTDDEQYNALMQEYVKSLATPIKQKETLNPISGAIQGASGDGEWWQKALGGIGGAARGLVDLAGSSQGAQIAAGLAAKDNPYLAEAYSKKADQMAGQEASGRAATAEAEQNRIKSIGDYGKFKQELEVKKEEAANRAAELHLQMRQNKLRELQAKGLKGADLDQALNDWEKNVVGKISQKDFLGQVGGKLLGTGTQTYVSGNNKEIQAPKPKSQADIDALKKAGLM